MEISKANLKDIGYPENKMDDFMASDVEAQIYRLKCHRKKVLDKIHREEKIICCTDYLINAKEKEL